MDVDKTPPENAEPAVQRHTLMAGDGTRIVWRSRNARSRSRGSIVLTNGLSTTDEFWNPLLASLTGEYRVADWWYRGHGQSESARSNDYAIATHADDLRRVTEAAREVNGGDTPVHVAFSMGVTVLLELYRVRPDLVRAMVLIAGGADHPHASSPVLRFPGVHRALRAGLQMASPLVPALSPLAKRVSGSRALFPVAQRLGALGEDAPRDEVERFFRSVGAMDLRAYWETMRSLFEQKASDVLPNVKVPVLVIAPEHDVMAPLRELHALRDAIPNAAWMELPRTSHAVLLEAGDKIASRVAVFLAALA